MEVDKAKNVLLPKLARLTSWRGFSASLAGYEPEKSIKPAESPGRCGAPVPKKVVLCPGRAKPPEAVAQVHGLCAHVDESVFLADIQAWLCSTSSNRVCNLGSERISCGPPSTAFCCRRESLVETRDLLGLQPNTSLAELCLS